MIRTVARILGLGLWTHDFRTWHGLLHDSAWSAPMFYVVFNQYSITNLKSTTTERDSIPDTYQLARTIAVAVEQRIVQSNWSREQQRLIIQGVRGYGSRPTRILQMLSMERGFTSSCIHYNSRHNLRSLTVESAVKTGKLHILPY